MLPQRDWQPVGWRDDDKNVPAPVPVPVSAPVAESSSSLSKISEQKGILGPGPAELRFPEAL